MQQIYLNSHTEKENSAITWWSTSQRQTNKRKQQSILQREKDVKLSGFESSNWPCPSRLCQSDGQKWSPLRPMKITDKKIRPVENA